MFGGTRDSYHRLSSVKKLGEWWGSVWGCWEGTRDCLGVPGGAHHLWLGAKRPRAQDGGDSLGVSWGFAHIGGYQGNCLGGA